MRIENYYKKKYYGYTLILEDFEDTSDDYEKHYIYIDCYKDKKGMVYPLESIYDTSDYKVKKENYNFWKDVEVEEFDIDKESKTIWLELVDDIKWD